MKYIKTTKKIFISASIALIFSFGLVALNTNRVFADDVSEIKDKQEDLESEIVQEQKKLEASQGLLNKNVAQVSTTKTVLQKTESDILRKEKELDALNKRAELNKSILENYLQQAYYSDLDPLLELTVADRGIGDISENFDQMLSINDKILLILNDIDQNSQEIEGVKNELSDKKLEHQKLLQKQKAEQGEIVADINETKATLSELQAKFAELQSDLNRLLGTNYNAKDIKDAVNFANDKTNVPKGFLVGVLKMETNLGANVGGCTYSQVESGAQASYKAGKLGKTAWATFQKRRDTFKAICKELDLDYKKQKVSCNPKGYTGTGGAMGVAQFMPDTWNAYKSQVSGITGHNPPSPWNLTDGVMAMAVKLARTPGVTSGKESAMRSAACSYLGTCYKPYIDGIMYWAKNYKTLLD
ncbi:MAG: lytic murein transglycosylase [Candidatus Moraniibacteriota bacterium]